MEVKVAAHDGDQEHCPGGRWRPENNLGERNAGPGCDAEDYEVRLNVEKFLKKALRVSSNGEMPAHPEDFPSRSGKCRSCFIEDRNRVA